MTAEDIAKALGGFATGGSGYVARCPAHDDSRPSLSVRQMRDGAILLKCFAGCENRDIIDALRKRGLWRAQRHSPQASQITRRAESDRRTERALKIWREAQLAPGTLVEKYLRARGILIPVPSSIRFHPSLKHISGGKYPAMIALVTTGIDNVPLAIHRIYLSQDGEKAAVTPQKMMFGPCSGGAVKLESGVTRKRTLVGEGIETCLAGMQIFNANAYASLSTSGLRRLKLPTCVEDIRILADNDKDGIKAAKSAQERWRSEGRTVELLFPWAGKDFNDRLVTRYGQRA